MASVTMNAGTLQQWLVQQRLHVRDVSLDFLPHNVEKIIWGVLDFLPLNKLSKDQSQHCATRS